MNDKPKPAQRPPRTAVSTRAVPPGHPLRPIRALADEILADLSPDFTVMYSARGRPSVAPEKMLRAVFLQVLYGWRSERMLVRRIKSDPGLRWFVGLASHEPVWHSSTLTKNRLRFVERRVARRFLETMLVEGRRRQLLGSPEFAIDLTPLGAWGDPTPTRAPDRGRAS